MSDNDDSEKRGPDSDEEIGPCRKQGKSGRSVIHSFVRFVNSTSRKVDVIWLNYEGRGIKYKTLDPEKYVDVNTFVGHPWTFRDSETGLKMRVQSKEVYKPVGWGKHEGWPPQRKVVHITIPVYSLLDRCLQTVHKLVPRSQISNLEIPQILIDELLHPSSSSSVPSLSPYEHSEQQRRQHLISLAQQELLHQHHLQEQQQNGQQPQ